MTNEQLEHANSLKKEIDKLTSFIFLASRNGFWEEITIKKELKMFTNVIPYKQNDKEGYKPSKELTLKVIDVLQKQVDEWKRELNNI